MTRGDNKIEVIRKGDKVAIKNGDEDWKTPAELADANGGGGGNPGRFAGRAAQNLPAKTAMDLVADVKELTASGDGFAGALSEEGAKKALTFGRRGGNNQNAPEVSNAKGDVKFTTKDGVLSGYELHVTGSVTVNGNNRDVDRTTTVQIMDVGSTKVAVPDEAKKKLEG
jgi:ATP phosphoribosyltransferase regulatory subunit HisZ